MNQLNQYSFCSLLLIVFLASCQPPELVNGNKLTYNSEKDIYSYNGGLHKFISRPYTGKVEFEVSWGSGVYKSASRVAVQSGMIKDGKKVGKWYTIFGDTTDILYDKTDTVLLEQIDSSIRNGQWSGTRIEFNWDGDSAIQEQVRHGKVEGWVLVYGSANNCQNDNTGTSEKQQYLWYKYEEKDGKKNGREVIYSNEGTADCFGDRPSVLSHGINANDMMHGTWTEYDEEKTITKTFVNDVMEGPYKETFQDVELIGQYKDDKKHGVWKRNLCYWSPDSCVTEIITYENGLKHGLETMYSLGEFYEFNNIRGFSEGEYLRRQKVEEQKQKEHSEYVRRAEAAQKAKSYASNGSKCTWCKTPLGVYYGGVCTMCGAAAPDRLRESARKMR